MGGGRVCSSGRRSISVPLNIREVPSEAQAIGSEGKERDAREPGGGWVGVGPRIPLRTIMIFPHSRTVAPLENSRASIWAC